MKKKMFFLRRRFSSFFVLSVFTFFTYCVLSMTKTPSAKPLQEDGINDSIKRRHTKESERAPQPKEVTIVTAYYDLGTFSKGNINTKFTKAMYFNWAKVFAYMDNALVVYTDAPDFYELMTSLRRGKENKTRMFQIARNSSWAFQNEPKIKEIFSNPSYPKHYPNTVVSGYSCSQHAKYDVIGRVAHADIFKTRYIAWLDVGYFRNRESNHTFRLELPEGFNESRVTMTQVYDVSMDTSPTTIFRDNKVWVGGGLFVGERNILIRFANQFRQTVEYYLSRGLANTDQQVLYAMFSKEGREVIKPEVDIQLYRSSDWFLLGYNMLNDL